MAESEMVVMQATGFSSFRLARPVLWFGLIVAGMILILAHILVPASRATLASRSAEISANVTSRFLNDGQFMHPAAGITIYIRQITANGELRDMFLADDRSALNRVTYTAARALLVRGDTGPKLIMFDGMAQSVAKADARLSVTRFADFTYDLGALISVGGNTGRTVDELSTADLLRAEPAIIAETGATRAAFLYEAHSRFATPFLATAAALIGFASLLLGGFSRFGLWRQIMFAVVLLILMQMLNTAAAGEGLRSDARWWLAYVAPVLGLALAVVLLWWSQRPRRVPEMVAA